MQMSFKRETSRAPTRKRHDPQAFLTIGDPEDEANIVTDVFRKTRTAEGQSIGNPRAAASVIAVRAASSTADNIVKAPETAAVEQSVAKNGGAVSASHSASTQRSSSRFNDSFASFERRATARGGANSRRSERRPLASPPTVGLYVRSPFKQDLARTAAANGSLVSAPKSAALPGVELIEATLIATVEVDRAIREEVQRSRALLAAGPAVASGQLRAPRLLKAPMRPLEVVHFDAPTIAQCRGVQATSTAAPRATTLSALINFDEGSRCDTRIKSSGTSRPTTETGSRQRSAVTVVAAAATAASSTPAPLSSQVPKSALRRTSAKRSADAQAKGSPAPRNSFNEETEEVQSEPAEESSVCEQPTNSAIIEEFGNPPAEHKQALTSALSPAHGERPGTACRQMTPSSYSGSGRGHLGRGQTFLTENADSSENATSTTLVARAEPTASGLPSGKAAVMEKDDNLEQATSGSGGVSRARLLVGGVDAPTPERNAPTIAEQLVVVVDNAARTSSSAASGTFAADSGRRSGERVSPLSESSSSLVTASAAAARQTERVDEVASEEAAPRRVGSGIRCKDSVDGRRRPPEDDDDENDTGSGGGGGGSSGRPNAPCATIAVSGAAGGDKSAAASDSAVNADGSAAVDGDSGVSDRGYVMLRTTACSGIPDPSLADDEKVESLEAQLSAVIADLRRQRSSLFDGFFGVDKEDASSAIEIGVSELQPAWGAAWLKTGSAHPHGVSGDSAAAGEDECEQPNLSLCLSTAFDRLTTSEEADNAILLNRDHRTDDIYEDLFYYCWGAHNLAPSCLSRHLTGPRPQKDIECIARRKGPPAGRRPAWEQNKTCLYAALEMSQSGAAVIGGEERAVTNSQPRYQGESIAAASACAASELCVRPVCDTEGKWGSRTGSSYTPPPLCFDVNARPPAGHFYYFSYGMHMNAGRLAASLGRAVDDFRLWGLLFGFQLIFNKRGVDKQAGLFPNIEYNPLASVEGCVYRLTSADLSLLDAYHGYPAHYARAVLPVWVVNCLDPDNYGVAQHCVPAVAYVAQDGWLSDAACQSDRGARDYSLRQCLKSADLLTSNYKRQLLLMCSRQ